MQRGLLSDILLNSGQAGRTIKINKTTFYILSCTWGILYTLAGALVAGVLLLTGHKARRWGWVWYFEVGRSSWGGMEWGPVFVKDQICGDHIKNHEFGHAIQNCFYGPFMIVLVSLPSTVRYWTRRIGAKHGRRPKTAYESVWFEAQATRFGTYVMEQCVNKTGQAL